MTHELPIWTLKDVQTHLQAAVDLELWTIPFYMAAMYSITEPSDPSYQLLQSVIHQEMLHMQLAANVANAYSCELRVEPPAYVGHHIPHLDFALDKPDPRLEFHPYSAEIGPLDLARVNSMCLIEYPKWGAHERPELRPTISDYGSIGEFYKALRLGMTERSADLRGGHNQVDLFGRYYQNLSQLTVKQSGPAGLASALRLIQIITTQGEGEVRGEIDVPTMFQNTADDTHAGDAHFGKFTQVREAVLSSAKRHPVTYDGVAHPPAGSAGHAAQEILVRDFRVLCDELGALFRGKSPPDFGPRMMKVGAAISNCWKNGAIPRFS